MAFGKLHCMLCGKEKLEPEARPEQEFYLCWDCARFWPIDYVRRVRASIADWLHGRFHTGGV
jgi:hypothetical protein